MQSWPDPRALLADVRRAVGRYMPEDARDLETMIYLGRAEMAPPLG